MKTLLRIILGLVLVAWAMSAALTWATWRDMERTSRTMAEEVSEADAIIAATVAKRNAPVFIELPGAKPIEALRKDFTVTDSLWALVNKTHAIPESYVPADLTTPNVPIRGSATGEERMVRQVAIPPLEKMFADASAQGHSLMIGSAYRSSVTQRSLFASYAASAGFEEASKYSAQPGHSEHQLGLAVDISSVSQQCYLSECFISTPDGQWLAENAHTYGFMLRYHKGKEAVTGYNFEPWHYRYVGVPLATALHESGMTLEEAWPAMETALQTLKDNGVTL